MTRIPVHEWLAGRRPASEEDEWVQVAIRRPGGTIYLALPAGQATPDAFAKLLARVLTAEEAE